jgi:hypothetical protein
MTSWHSAERARKGPRGFDRRAERPAGRSRRRRQKGSTGPTLEPGSTRCVSCTRPSTRCLDHPELEHPVAMPDFSPESGETRTRTGGHHDFQGVVAERFSPQNACKSVVSRRRHRDAMPLVSVGFPWVWDSMESLKSQTSRVRRARRTSGSPQPCRRAGSVDGRPCDRRPCCGTGSTAPRSGSTSGRRGTAWSRAQAGRAR